MKAVVLAAGEGSRLRPFTETRPKVMLPIANRPILEYKVRTLSALGIDEVVLVVGYGRKKIQSNFEDGDRWGVDVEYVVQEDQLGTAHALGKVRDAVGDRFLVVNGDNIVHPGAVESFLDTLEAGNGMLLKRVEVTDGYGAVETSDGLVRTVEEKPGEGGTRQINLGIYLFTDEIFDAIDATGQSPRGEYEITESIQRMIDGGVEVCGVKTDRTWMDAVYPWDLVRVNGAVLDGGADFHLGFSVEGRVEEGAVLRGPVSVGEGSVVRSGAYVVGPCVIGKNCDVGSGAAVLPGTSVGHNASVGANATLDNSVLMKGTRVGSSASVESCVLGEGTRVGSHFVSDAGEARVEVKDRLHRVDDIGGMIADGSRVEGNVTVSPGRIVGRRCEVKAGTVVSENVESGTRLTG